MADTTFVDGVTLTDADWFNDVNRLHYTILGDPTNATAVRGAVMPHGSVAAHATTMNPWAYGVVTLTGGAVTFTDIADASYVGQQVLLIMNAAHVFTDGAVFDVQGGQNYTAEAGDQVLLVATAVDAFDLTIFKASGATAAKKQTRSVLTSGTAATYTTPTGATRLNVQVKGGGGNGNDGGDGSGNGGGGGGGGGGEGGMAVKLIVGPSSTYTYTVGGAASNSSFGSVTGNGGSAGTTGSTTPRAGTGGAGGGGSGGDYYIYGAAGQSGDNGGGGTNANVGGLGGAGGGAGSGKGGSAGVNGTAASANSGAGGGGGGGGDGTAGAHGSGAAGAAGVIIVDEYYD